MYSIRDSTSSFTLEGSFTRPLLEHQLVFSPSAAVMLSNDGALLFRMGHRVGGTTSQQACQDFAVISGVKSPQTFRVASAPPLGVISHAEAPVKCSLGLLPLVARLISSSSRPT